MILGSVLIYGVVYFPLFAGLATRTLVGYSVSCAYAWMFAVVDVFQTFECELNAVRFKKNVIHYVCADFIKLQIMKKAVDFTDSQLTLTICYTNVTFCSPEKKVKTYLAD